LIYKSSLLKRSAIAHQYNKMKKDRLNAYRIMWVLVFFDLPTETAYERKVAAKFRKNIMKDGFQMFQFSIYLRHCASMQNAEVHILRTKKILPEKGHVGILSITDKQFGDIEIYYGKKIKPNQGIPQQLEMF
jgi:CRISPR-associated protein Cas2